MGIESCLSQVSRRFLTERDLNCGLKGSEPSTFRIVKATEFIGHFASDRSHMVSDYQTLWRHISKADD